MRESVVIDLIPVNVKDLRSRRSLICHLDARRSRGPRAHRSVRLALVYTGYAAGTELTTLDLCCITDYNPPRLAISAWTRLLFGAPGRRCHAGRGSCDSRLAPDRTKFWGIYNDLTITSLVGRGLSRGFSVYCVFQR